MANVKVKDIDVVITDNGMGGLAFALDANNGNGHVQQVGFNNSRHPGIVIHFNIDDQADSGLTFQPVPDDAIWAALNPNWPGQNPDWPIAPDCPDEPPAPWSELVPLSVEEDKHGNRTQLIVYFRNTNEDVHFNFALRFLDPGGNEVNYDPIGDGNNGLRS